MVHVNLHKVYTVKICDRVNLYLNDTGFTFSNKPANKIDTLNDWSTWAEYWRLYERDNIKDKVYAFLDTMPEHAKGRKFYQAIVF